MNIIGYSKTYLWLFAILMLVSIVSLAIWGLKLSIDFTGGALMEVEFLNQRPTNAEIQNELSDLELGQVILQPAGDMGLIVRLRDIDEATHQQILEKLGADQGQVEEKSFESVGPLIGKELKTKTIWAIIVALIAINLYIAWSFRKVSKPVTSWQYGVVAVVALFHDVVVTLGVFAVLGHFKQVQIDLSFIAAMLTILGYSVNNNIVIFDRARENLLRTHWTDFEQVINRSVNQTMARCLNTSLTVLFVLLAIFFLGGATIKYFSLALIVGVVIGTASAIFMTSPLIVVWQRWRYRSRK